MTVNSNFSTPVVLQILIPVHFIIQTVTSTCGSNQCQEEEHLSGTIVQTMLVTKL